MEVVSAYMSVISEHWTIWFVTVVLIVAAVIDGFELKVPNWVTFPFIVSGWIYSTYAFGWEGLGFDADDLASTREWLRSRANTIEGGTSEVQLNIIAKNVLGLGG